MQLAPEYSTQIIYAQKNQSVHKFKFMQMTSSSSSWGENVNLINIETFEGNKTREDTRWPGDWYRYIRRGSGPCWDDGPMRWQLDNKLAYLWFYLNKPPLPACSVQNIFCLKCFCETKSWELFVVHIVVWEEEKRKLYKIWWITKVF